MKYLIVSTLMMVPVLAYGANCGVGAGMPASGCNGKETVTSLTRSCKGSGLIGCVQNKDMKDWGVNSSEDCLEIYCLASKTRVCLSGEKCPWRNDNNMKANVFSKGLQSDSVKWSAETMTCSPFGTRLMPDSTDAAGIAKKTGDAPFERITCDVAGRMTIEGDAPGIPEGIPKFGEVCGSKPRPCKPGIKCGSVEQKTYDSYDNMTTNNATFVHAGPCK